MREMKERKVEGKLRDVLCLNAPVLTGLKPSAIINVSEEEYLALHRIFLGTEIRIFALSFDKRMTILLYRAEELLARLSDLEVKRCLESIDSRYRDLPLKDLLLHFRERFRVYKASKMDFPHELGLFLGYPVEDVRAYIDHKGLDALTTGYWKVYHNLPTALRTFRAYDFSIQSFHLLLEHGVSIDEILEFHSKGRAFVLSDRRLLA